MSLPLSWQSPTKHMPSTLPAQLSSEIIGEKCQGLKGKEDDDIKLLPLASVVCQGKRESVDMIAFQSENLSALDWTSDQWPAQYVRSIHQHLGSAAYLSLNNNVMSYDVSWALNLSNMYICSFH